MTHKLEHQDLRAKLILPAVFDRIRVLDAKALGDPGVLGTAEVSLKEAQLQPNAGARNSWLPLKVRHFLVASCIPEHTRQSQSSSMRAHRPTLFDCSTSAYGQQLTDLAKDAVRPLNQSLLAKPCTCRHVTQFDQVGMAACACWEAQGQICTDLATYRCPSEFCGPGECACLLTLSEYTLRTWP